MNNEMDILRAENERLRHEQEKIMKTLYDKQNHRQPIPIPEPKNLIGNKDLGGENTESEYDQERQEEESENISDHKRNQRQEDELQGEFKKIKPPIVDNEQEEDVEAWLISMKKYFQLYAYDHNLKDRLVIYQLQVKSTLWWDEVKRICGINEKNVTSEKFQKHFKDKYLTQIFYDEKVKGFHNIWLG